MPTEQFANNAQTTLAAAVPAAVAGAPGTITVSPATGFPAGPQFRVRVGGELMLVTAVAGTTWAVTRGVEGTAAAAHAAGDAVTQVLTAGALDAATALPHRPTGRLTTEAGSAVSAADRAAQGTLFYTGGLAFLYDGARFRSYTFGELSAPLSGLPAGVNYDVFLWGDGGTPALKIGPAWANSGAGTSARGPGAGTTELEAIGGLWVNQSAVAGGPPARAGLYLGTVRTSGAGVTEDSRARRFLWNMYNRVSRPLFRGAAAGGHQGTGGAWAPWLASLSHRLEVVVGWNDSPVEVAFTAAGTSTAGSSTFFGIALDNVSTPSGVVPLCGGGSIPYYQTAVARFRDFVGIGYHYLQALEWGLPAASFGGDGSPGPTQGMDGFLMG